MQVQSLVGELRSHMLRRAATKPVHYNQEKPGAAMKTHHSPKKMIIIMILEK